MFQFDAWYVASLPEEIDLTLRRRLILDVPVLLYRTEAGKPVGLRDLCPHRFAPLSLGKLIGDTVQCAYHGLRFGPDGRCALNPHSDLVAPHNRVASYPMIERHGFVWIWLGDSDRADEDRIPDLSYMTAPGCRTANTRIEGAFRYDILMDNLADLSHTDYLHDGSFTGGPCERSEVQIADHGDDVIVSFYQWRAPRPPLLAGYPDVVDVKHVIHWHPGNVIAFAFHVTPTGQEFSGTPFHRYAHIATPQTAESIHYFLSTSRDYALDDRELDTAETGRMVAVITGEDNPILRAVSSEMAGRDLMDMRPVILPTDRGGLAVRQKIQKLIKEERQRSAA